LNNLTLTKGIPNRQLVIEDDPLAILYNDQSIAENRSLFLGFSELLKDDFKELRNAMFVSTDEYRRFRKAVLNLVLATDIASPERTQIGKSKWKEAFGDPFETVERKVRSEIKRRQSASTGASPSAMKLRRASAASMCSMYSEITTDIPEDFVLGDDEEDSPSVTPESSFNGEDYSDDDLDLSQDGMIVSSKPFSNVTSSSHLQQHTYGEEGPIEASELGYEPDKADKPDNSTNMDDLGYETPTPKSLNDTAHSHPGQISHKNSPTNKTGQFVAKPGKKPMMPKANRNLSMPTASIADYRRGSNPKQMSKFQRRFSTSVVQGQNNKKFKFRLGILRAVDLSGEAIETYSRSSGTGTYSLAPSSVKAPSTVVGDTVDELDELKVTVIMEQLITAAGTVLFSNQAGEKTFSPASWQISPSQSSLTRLLFACQISRITYRAGTIWSSGQISSF
jgi:hypothetical protein